MRGVYLPGAMATSGASKDDVKCGDKIGLQFLGKFTVYK